MNTRVDALLDEALVLDADQRSALVMALIDSLDPAVDPAVDAAWRLELLRRREALQAGSAAALPWAEARARLSRL